MRRLAHAIGVAEALVLAASAVVGAYFVAHGESRQVLNAGSIWLMLAVTSAVGWLLASRLPHHPLGWLLLTVAGLFLLAVPMFALGMAVQAAHPGLASWFFWYSSGGDVGWSWLPPVGLLFTQVLLRFPDGQLPSPRWRWFSRFTLVAVFGSSVVLATAPGSVGHGLSNPIGWGWVEDHGSVLVAVIAPCLLVSFVGSAASVVVRYRRGSTLTRTQIRWVAFAGSVVIGFYVLSFVVPGSALDNWVVLAYTLIPASIGVAVLRYRLYDIDRVVSRTTAYAIVTVTVVLVYAMLVTAVSRVAPGSSSLAVAVATLSAAALFRPVLLRVQRRVERRFNRSRYDARRTVERFASALDREVDTHAVLADLGRAVSGTVQPASYAVWLSTTDR